MPYGDYSHNPLFTEMLLKYKNGSVILFMETHNAWIATPKADVSKKSVQFQGWKGLLESGCSCRRPIWVVGPSSVSLHISPFQKSFSLLVRDALCMTGLINLRRRGEAAICLEQPALYGPAPLLSSPIIGASSPSTVISALFLFSLSLFDSNIQLSLHNLSSPPTTRS